MSVDVTSPSLTAFYGTSTQFHATVLLPDDYYKQPNRRFPVVYVVPAFFGPYKIDYDFERSWQRPQRDLGVEFIVVILQGMVVVNGEEMHHQFADSLNDGPWDTALNLEFIPGTDRHFRTIPDAGHRFLFGHSSGGWTVLWQQIEHPDTYGGVWALSPDSVDFHDFMGPDITTAPNMYVDPQGRDYHMYRDGDGDRYTLRDFVQRTLIGKLQYDTYDYVYGPKGADGRPVILFDRKTGAINHAVASYWEQRWDITHVLTTNWSTLGPSLDRKLHVFVGSDDTFHLEGAVERMKAALIGLGGRAEIEVVPHANHWTIYNAHGGLIRYAVEEMKETMSAEATMPERKPQK